MFRLWPCTSLLPFVLVMYSFVHLFPCGLLVHPFCPPSLSAFCLSDFRFLSEFPCVSASGTLPRPEDDGLGGFPGGLTCV